MGIVIVTPEHKVEFTGMEGRRRDIPMGRILLATGDPKGELKRVRCRLSPAQTRAYHYAVERRLSKVDVADVPADFKFNSSTVSDELRRNLGRPDFHRYYRYDPFMTTLRSLTS